MDGKPSKVQKNHALHERFWLFLPTQPFPVVSEHTVYKNTELLFLYIVAYNIHLMMGQIFSLSFIAWQVLTRSSRTQYTEYLSEILVSRLGIYGIEDIVG